MTSAFWNMAALFAGAFAAVFLLTPFVRRLAIGLGRISPPRTDRWHSRPTAVLGGVAIFGGIAAVAGAGLPWTPQLTGIGLGLLAIFLLGLMDDFIGIPPYVKLIGQLIAAVIPLMFGVRIEMFAHPAVAVLVTVAWFVVVTNAFNLLDNMDGLSAGIAAISASILGVEAVMRGDLIGGSLAMVVGGSALGFLPFNFHPARIFMGDCGSMTLGYALAATAIMGPWSDSTNLLLTLSVPFLILAVPLFDTAFVAVVRTINGRPISQGGRDHTSHRLVFLGLPEPRAVLMLYALSGGLGLLALVAARYEVYTAIVVVAGVAIFLFFFGVFLGEVKVYKERDMPPDEEETRNLTRLYTTVYYKKQIVEVVVDVILITAAYISAFLLRFEGHLSQGNAALIVQSLPMVLAVSMASFLYFGLYRAVWRYVGLHDLLNVAKAVATATVLSMLGILLLTRFAGYSRSVFVIFGLLALVFVGGSRALVRLLREYIGQATKGGRRVLIYGAGDAGELIIREIRHHRTSEFKPVGIIDDDPSKVGFQIHGVPVLGGARDLGRLAVETGVEEVIIAIPSADESALDTIQSTCSAMGLKVRRMSATLSEEEQQAYRP